MEAKIVQKTPIVELADGTEKEIKVYNIMVFNMPIKTSTFATNNFNIDIARTLGIDYGDYIKTMTRVYNGLMLYEVFNDNIRIDTIGFIDYDDAEKALDWINSFLVMDKLVKT